MPTTDEVLATLFNAPAGGSLHVENLKGATGELALRVGDHEPFGVINVGDDDKLLGLCEASGLGVATRDFAGSLFHEINQPASTVNLLIGSRKFTEGWSSWRVSTMGLMNIGKSEGSQIIQLFGRGVRLQGYGGSLKRSSTYGPLLATPQHIGVLETLGVFGVHADYMATFRDFLIEEGLPADEATEVLLPIRTNLGATPLRTLKLRDTIGGRRTEFGDAFRNRGPIPTLLAPSQITDALALRSLQGKIVLNWYPKVQSRRSAGATGWSLGASPRSATRWRMPRTVKRSSTESISARVCAMQVRWQTVVRPVSAWMRPAASTVRERPEPPAP